MNSPAKKQRKPATSSQGRNQEARQSMSINEAEASPENVRDGIPAPPAIVGEIDLGLERKGTDGYSQQGLLEDVVPLLIRNPLINPTFVNSSSSSSIPSPPASPFSMSWPPDYSSFGFGV